MGLRNIQMDGPLASGPERLPQAASGAEASDPSLDRPVNDRAPLRYGAQVPHDGVRVGSLTTEWNAAIKTIARSSDRKCKTYQGLPSRVN